MTTKSDQHSDNKHDNAVDLTFPASDPPAHGKATGTEPGRRPVDRKAPAISKQQIEQAQRGDGHNIRSSGDRRPPTR